MPQYKLMKLSSINTQTEGTEVSSIRRHLFFD